MATHNQAYETLFVTSNADFVIPHPTKAGEYFWIYKDQQFKWILKETIGNGGCTTCPGASKPREQYIIDSYAHCTEPLWGGVGAAINADKVYESNELLLPPQGQYDMITELQGQHVNWQDPNDPNRDLLHQPQWIPPFAPKLPDDK